MRIEQLNNFLYSPYKNKLNFTAQNEDMQTSPTIQDDEFEKQNNADIDDDINFEEEDFDENYRGETPAPIRNRRHNIKRTARKRTAKQDNQNNGIKKRTFALSTAFFFLIGTVASSYINTYLSKAQNFLATSKYTRNSENYAQKFMENLLKDLDTPISKSKEISVTQNEHGDFVEIKRKNPNNTSYTYRIESPDGDKITYDDVKNSRINSLVDKNMVTKAAIDFNDDGKDDLIFEFEHGDFNRTKISYDFECDGKIDKSVTTIIEEFN